MNKFIDSHCHLDAPEFDPDRAAVLTRARAAGVAAQVVPAVSAAGFPALRALCAAAPDLHPAYGLHPLYLAEHRPEHLETLAAWLEREHAVAVGECGLDFWNGMDDAQRQREFLAAQLALARRFDLPLILHARRATEELIHVLRRAGGLRGVVHSFSGSAEQARQLRELGFLIGVGGPVTWPRARRLRRLVAEMPLEFLLLETDAPDQPLEGRRGERNEPARVADVCATIAGLREASIAEIASATSENARRLFRLPA